MTNFTKGERAIARKLGVTPFGLWVLTQASVRGDYVRGGMAGPALEAKGYLAPVRRIVTTKTGGTYDYPARTITEAGRVLVARARALGW